MSIAFIKDFAIKVVLVYIYITPVASSDVMQLLDLPQVWLIAMNRAERESFVSHCFQNSSLQLTSLTLRAGL